VVIDELGWRSRQSRELLVKLSNELISVTPAP